MEEIEIRNRTPLKGEVILEPAEEITIINEDAVEELTKILIQNIEASREKDYVE